MIVAGVMSGTSADGIDVALVRILGQSASLRLRLISHQHFAYARQVREAVLAAMNASSASVANLSRLNFLLGELYSDALEKATTGSGTRLQLIGCHGQTLYHQDKRELYLGRPVACTWQSGEAALISARLGLPVVSDFRVADMAAGGSGAPLVPLLDVAYYAHRTRLRILQNLGGIGNLTIIPPGRNLAKLDGVLAFDTGPGNMVIDACAQALFGKPYDANGSIAAKGRILDAALAAALQHAYFRRKPPKSAGREQFGREFVAQFLRWCGRRAKKEDVLTTATALTAASIELAIRQNLGPVPSKGGDYVVSGGGTKNRTLLRMLAERVGPMGLRLRTSDDLGMPSQAKEAVAFALLAYQTWHKLPGNVPGATGAARPVVLGKISWP